MKILKLDQGSQDWLRWRETGLGSSDAPIILGVSPWATPKELFERKLKIRIPQRTNSAMQRGKDLEPEIRKIYEDLFGYKVEPICGIHDTIPWLKVSLDGWNEERKIAIEIKAPNKDDHLCSLGGKVPEKYLPQCDHQLLVSNGNCLHYISYNPRFPKHEELAIVKHLPNSKALEALLEAEKEFWSWIENRKFKG